ncbi:MAG TPA: glycosyltransferase [Actinobacteria bacterium]|nr:glycosyltransferase [Actinomycetota bacterium]
MRKNQKSNLKILHINNVANVPSTLVEGLKKAGFSAQLYQPAVGTDNNHKLSNLALLSQRIKDILKLAKYIKNEDFDIVHIHYAYFGILGIIGRYPFFLHCHGTDVRENLKHPIFKFPTIFSLKKASKVLYSTPDLYQYIKPIRKDAVFLPNPVDTENFKPANIKNQPEAEDGISILIISRLDKTKGAVKAFEAAKIIKEKHPNVSFAAFEWGDDLRNYPFVPEIKLIQKVEYQQMPKIINSYDIIIGQLEIGAIGMSELEALASGKPVICNFIYGNIYKESPPFLLAKDAKDIKNHIETLIRKRGLIKKIGDKGRDWVVKNHGQETIVKELLKIYESY